jgi:hypothetical protein
MRKQPLYFLAMPILITAGCAHNQAEQVRDARMAQLDSHEEHALDSVEAREDAEKDAIDRGHAQTEKQLAATDSPDADARESAADVERDRAQYCAEAKAELDKLAVRLDATQKKIAVLGSRAPTKLHGELSTARTEHQTLKQNVDTLPRVPATGWDDQRKLIDKRMDELDDRVDKLSSAVDGAA